MPPRGGGFRISGLARECDLLTDLELSDAELDCEEDVTDRPRSPLNLPSTRSGEKDWERMDPG